MKAKLTATSAILLVKNVVTSSEYYRDKLGFTIVNYYGHPPGFAIVQRDENYLMFTSAPPDKIIPNWKIVEKTSNVYFWVNDAETLYKEYVDSGANIDYSLYTTPYGIKEFGINDPDEYDISFGEVIK